MNPFKIKFISQVKITEQSNGVAASFVNEIVRLRYEEKNMGFMETVAHRSKEALNDRKVELDKMLLSENSANHFFKTTSYSDISVVATPSRSIYTFEFNVTLFSDEYTCIAILQKGVFVYYGADNVIKFTNTALGAVIIQ